VILLDVNVLVHAFHEASPEHAAYRAWLEATVEEDEPFGLSEDVLSGFVRVATHPRVFDPPAPVGEALAFAAALRSQPNAVIIAPGTRHWEIFEHLCVAAGAKGNLVADAFLAALAIESGCEWITGDRDFSRFPGLRWRHPIADA
jgi:toxin-antitoxin system PIN domain toxin